MLFGQQVEHVETVDAFAPEFQKRGFVDVTFNQVESHGLVVGNQAGYFLFHYRCVLFVFNSVSVYRQICKIFIIFDAGVENGFSVVEQFEPFADVLEPD